MTMTSALTIPLIGNLTDLPDAFDVATTRLADGGYAVAATGATDTVLTIFDAAGAFETSLTIAGTQAALCQTDAGTLVVVTLANANDYRVTRLDANNNLIDQFLSNFVDIFYADFTVTALDNDRFCVALTDLSAGSGNNKIDLWNGSTYETTFDIDASTAPGFDVDITRLTDGNIVMAWTRLDTETGDTTVMYSVGNGVLAATEVTPGGSPGENRNAAVIATANGFAIAYESRVFGFTGMDIFIRYYDLAGNETGSDLVTNRSLGNTGIDDGTDDSAPAFARAPDGNIAITWTSNDGTDTDQFLALLATLDAQPEQVGFLQGANAQGNGAVTFFGSGQIAAWLVDGTTGSVRGQHFEGFRDSFGDETADNFTGDDFRDLINGLGGDDRLIGANGNDTIQGGDGSDTLFGDDGDDLLQGEEGNGAQAPGVHNDTLFGGAGNDTLYGEDGNDTLFGEDGVDQVFGGIGDDDLEVYDFHTEAGETYDGGANFDYLTVFGTGASVHDFRASTVTAIEQIYFASFNGGGATLRFNADQFTFQSVFFEPQGVGARVVSIDMEDVTTLNLSARGIQGTPGAGDRFEINGDDANETITGTTMADTINGGAGTDTLNGWLGADILTGGADNDRYYVDNAGDVVVEGAGEGTADRVLASVDYDLTALAQVELLTTTNTAGTDAIDLAGNDFSQTIHGNAGINTLDGYGGADTMVGFAGSDTYFVDTAADVVVEGANQGDADEVVAVVSYTLSAAAQIERLVTSDPFGTGAINLTGNGFAQLIVGNFGINVINGGGGADTMTGYAGNDQFYVDNAGDVVKEEAGEGTADRVLTSISYTLGAFAQVELFTTTNTAGTGAIKLTGNGFNQTIHGNAGANDLNGAGGADSMTGFGGDDRYFVDNAGDVLVEGAGQGLADRVLASVNYTLGAAAQIELFTTTNSAGVGAINLTGNGFNQIMHGNAGNNILDGKGGVDNMSGFAGNDWYYVDNTGDVVLDGVGQGTADRVFASVSIVLTAGAEIEILSTNNGAGTAAINFTGNGFGQSIGGNAGDNVIFGGGGDDSMVGFGGNDRYFVDSTGDSVLEQVGGGSADRVSTSISYTLTSGQEIELFTTTNGAGFDSVNLTGNNLAQSIGGNAGANVLNGGLGNDTLTGFGGLDTFFFNTALGTGNVDRIADFNVADDTIGLENAIFAGLAAGALAVGAFNTGAAATQADDRIIYNAATGALIFDADGLNGNAGIQFATLNAGLGLTAADFAVV